MSLGLKNQIIPFLAPDFGEYRNLSNVRIAPDGIEYMGYAVRTERYRYVAWRNEETQEFVAHELYDLDSDPAETVNLATDPARTELLQQLETLRQEGWRAALPHGG